MSKPHCIQLLNAKAWILENTGDDVCWTRSFGGPLNLRIASQTLLCVCGTRLPDVVLVNGVSMEIQGKDVSRMETEIGELLLDRNRVDLIWENESGREADHHGFASLSSVHLEIFE